MARQLNPPLNSYAPPRRYSAAMVYDENHGNILLFGGEDDEGALGDTWRWSDAGWTPLSPSSCH